MIAWRICCARHPPTAICMPGRWRFTEASWPRFPKSRVAAFSRTLDHAALARGVRFEPDGGPYYVSVEVAGIPRQASGHGAAVGIGGRRAPVTGRICMDQCLIDLGDDTYAVGEEVELFGSGPVTAADVAAWGETIPYEVTCNMSHRVPRTYTGGSFPPEAIEGT